MGLETSKPGMDREKTACINTHWALTCQCHPPRVPPSIPLSPSVQSRETAAHWTLSQLCQGLDVMPRHPQGISNIPSMPPTGTPGPGASAAALPEKHQGPLPMWGPGSALTSNEDSHTCVCSSTIHNSPTVEGTQVSVNVWMDKRNVASTWEKILFSLKKEILQYATAWTLRTLHKINKPAKKDRYSVIPLIYGT